MQEPQSKCHQMQVPGDISCKFTRELLAKQNFVLHPGETRNLVVYAGRTVKEWLDAGDEQGPETLTVRVHANAGPDAAELHWHITMRAQLLDAVQGRIGAVRVFASLPPEVSVEELPRTVPGAGTLNLRATSP
jgi:hypothetical protein